MARASAGGRDVKSGGAVLSAESSSSSSSSPSSSSSTSEQEGDADAEEEAVVEVAEEVVDGEERAEGRVVRVVRPRPKLSLWRRRLWW